MNRTFGHTPPKYRCRPRLSLLARKVALSEERLILLASVLLYGDNYMELRHNIAARYSSIRGVQVNQDGLKLNGTHQFLVHVEDVNTWVEVCIQ